MNPSLNRRHFLRTTGAAGLSLAATSTPLLRAAPTGGKLRVLSIGVIGTIGGTDRSAVASHPMAEIVGLCDIDRNSLAKAAKDHPQAFTCEDYREAFKNHADKFDAVIVSVPDHNHAPIMLTAMAHDKHVYGQKPLVHQLEEIVMIEKALAAKPKLVTQLGNQRMAIPGRRAAVKILREGMLGKAIEAYVWTSSPNKSRYFNYDKVLKEGIAPDHINYDLWLGPCAQRPFYEELCPIRWRSWWDFGTNGLGDWGCHILDVIFYAYDELGSPISVQTDCPEPAGEVFHVNPCKSVTTYAVKSDKFASNTFKIHYNDSNQAPSPEQMRIGEAVKTDNMTVVVCEKGTLVLEAGGALKIWRDGKAEQGLRMEGMPAKWEAINHWHAWVDHCLGKTDGELRAPFRDAVRITESALLSVKATRFPGKELLWDKSKLAFTNHEEATRTIVRRQYRDGFAPPTVG
ncbi:MAG TPA: Gfo/Idh/MocA family oxidoreductase [Luteolibacter sp.]|nr:Gfo/Idh/MocA family oxidoreductase [Luteolibacter sp.]